MSGVKQERKCWHVKYDGSYTEVYYDSEEGAEHRYCESYTTFTEAKGKLAEYFKERIFDFRKALQNCRSKRLSGFNTDTKIMTPEQYKTWTRKIVRF